MLKRFRQAIALLGVICALLPNLAGADPVSTTPRVTFSGNMNYVVSGGSLRTSSSNTCAVTNSNTENLSGIPAGSNIVSAMLYWAGSGPTPDNNVTLNGLPVSADRTFSEPFISGGYNLQFFSGFADVTSRISGNGSVTFSDLTVTNTDLGAGASYCSSAAVLSGWGLIVIYENPAEPLRVINLFDGFQQFRGSQVQLTPNNFIIPASPIDGKIGILTWEGDSGNSAPLGGVTENLVFDGESTPATALTDALNPLNNQYNSSVNVNGVADSWGVDFDTYDIGPLLRAGDTSAQTSYASGADLVLLSVQLVSVTNDPAADLALSLTHTGNFSTAAANSLNIDINNNGPSPDSGPITVTDTLTAGLTYQGFNSSDANWNCTAIGQDLTCTHPGPLLAGNALATVSALVYADDTTLPSISSTASVSSPTFDYFLANNSATDTAAVVIPDISTSSKSVLDVNGGVAVAGDTLRYSVRITETNGAAIEGIDLTDLIDPLLSNLVVVDALGGTDTSTTDTLTISNISAPASGFVDIIFEADIAGSAVNGDIIPNTAQLTDPVTGTIADLSSADIVVGAAGAPASGIKALYFGDIGGSANNPTLPMILSRIPLTGASSPARVRIRRNDNNRVWALTPPLQADLGIDAASIPVYLQLRRAGNSSTRNVRVSIAYAGSSNGFFGCVDLALSSSGANGLSNTVTREFIFNVARSDANCIPAGDSPLTLNAGTQIQVSVDNEPVVGPGGRAIYVYPYDTATGETSRAAVPATTVINVDSIGLFDAPFPAGVALTDLEPGDSFNLRAVVSDPFGSFDIASITYELYDPTGGLQASGALPVVQDSGVATVTAEALVTIPGSAVQGLWSTTITAIEGTEGTVTHSVQAVVNVYIANFILEKFVSTVSDPITGTTNPKSIPEAVHEYVIRVTNDGPSDADLDSVYIRDSLPVEMTMYLGSPVNPITFVDGSPASGLSFNFLGLSNTSDDIQFSNDGGTTFITPTVDIDGFDSTSPRINFLEFSPKGLFNAPSGSGSPNFELRFEMRLD